MNENNKFATLFNSFPFSFAFRFFSPPLEFDRLLKEVYSRYVLMMLLYPKAFACISRYLFSKDKINILSEQAYPLVPFRESSLFAAASQVNSTHM